MHPLFHLIATRPHLLAEHLEIYGELIGQEVVDIADAAKRRIVLYTAAVLGLMFGVVFAGVALMLWAITPQLDLRAIWVLWLVPLVPLVVALICVALARSRPPPRPFAQLREQLKADAAMLRETGAA